MMGYFRNLLPVFALCSGLAFAPIAAAQDAAAQDAAAQDAGNQVAADQIDDVVVVARRAEAPMWTVSRGGSSVILVGAIDGVPRDYAWRSEALGAATARSQRILYPIEAQGSLGDVMRLIWRIRTIGMLPKGKTTADFAPPELVARIERVMADSRRDSWRRLSFILLADEMTERAGYRDNGRGGAVRAVREAARRANVPGESVGIVRGDEVIDNLITAPPDTYLACLAASVGAAEAGETGARARLEDWRLRRVPQVLANPLEQAIGLCWPSGDPEIGPAARRLWAEAVAKALAQPDVTLAVAPLSFLAEPGGVLDQLAAQGLEIEGPIWREDQR